MRGEKVISILFFMMMIMMYCVSYAADMPAIVGVYEKVPQEEFRFDGKTIKVVEFLSFYCGHCFQFEKSIPVIKGNFPKKIDWEIVPIYWGKGSPKPGEAYLLARDAGKGDQMKKLLFDAVFLEQRDIGTIEVLEDLGAKLGLGFDFSMKLRSGEKSQEVQNAFNLVKQYNVEETPTLIISGNLKVSPGMVNNNVDLMKDNILLIIRSILKQ